MDYPSISLCMIIKNEEKYLANCLRSVENIIDEIIVVDTGSTDNSIKICEEFNAKVLRYNWNNSFSEARNLSLKQAKGDWILWLDADEEMDKEDSKNLKDHIKKLNSEKLISIQLINFIGKEKNINYTFNMAHTRLIKNHLGFKFIYNIHETLNIEEVLGEVKEIKMIPVKVYHYGYLDEEVENKKKSDRNLNLLLKELEKEHSPWIEYHIASEYYRMGNYNDSFDYVNRSIKGFIAEGKVPPSMLYKLKYSILITSGSINGAWPSINSAISLYPDYVDLHYFKGIILLYKEQYEEALAAFETCIELGEENLKHLTLKGVGGYLALYYKAACLEKIGDFKNAKTVYELCTSSAPDYKPAFDALKKINSAN